jgi:3-oxoacyl-[acyl-carrier protein] reductase
MEPGIHTFVADAADPNSAECAINAAANKFGGLDILVNNAGGVDKIGGFTDLRNEDWLQAFELNVMSAVYAVRQALPWLRRSRNARIINVASISGVEPGLLVPHYCAAKAALINLSKHLANTLAGDRILVNVVCPGQVHTEARQKLAEYVAESEDISISAAIDKIDSQGAARIPLGRIGEPGDVAQLITFLASDRASWITGSCFHIDGGKLRSAF